ncbi:MAG: hypothetical protein J0H19_25605 [Rhodospirillales bacterium]|nr:hypothetical protein [Rhodospirillales bacterium]MBN8929982.1 hypothetical protein [Rhodospirillales bacterium]
MHELVPANDNVYIDPNFVNAVHVTMDSEEKIHEIATDLRNKLAMLRRGRLRRHA